MKVICNYFTGYRELYLTTKEDAGIAAPMAKKTAEEEDVKVRNIGGRVVYLASEVDAEIARLKALAKELVQMVVDTGERFEEWADDGNTLEEWAAAKRDEIDGR